MAPRKLNFDRVCVECGFHSLHKSGLHMCDRPVSVVTGNPQPVQCLTARADNGHCGPDGRSYSAASAVEAPSREKPANGNGRGAVQ